MATVGVFVEGETCSIVGHFKALGIDVCHLPQENCLDRQKHWYTTTEYFGKLKVNKRLTKLLIYP